MEIFFYPLGNSYQTNNHQIGSIQITPINLFLTFINGYPYCCPCRYASLYNSLNKAGFN